jgi:hypothetical protein
MLVASHFGLGLGTFQGVCLARLICAIGPLCVYPLGCCSPGVGSEGLPRNVCEHESCVHVLCCVVLQVMLGASAVLSNGTVLSRAGSAAVAMTAHASSKPVLVCCEAFKVGVRHNFERLSDPLRYTVDLCCAYTSSASLPFMGVPPMYHSDAGVPARAVHCAGHHHQTIPALPGLHASSVPKPASQKGGPLVQSITH